jgi:hypothetical protein
MVSAIQRVNVLVDLISGRCAMKKVLKWIGIVLGVFAMSNLTAGKGGAGAKFTPAIPSVGSYSPLSSWGRWTFFIGYASYVTMVSGLPIPGGSSCGSTGAASHSSPSPLPS